MSNPSPKFLKPHDGLTATQRKSCGLEKVAPRVRLDGEAMPRMICNASIREVYRTGQGDNAGVRTL